MNHKVKIQKSGGQKLPTTARPSKEKVIEKVRVDLDELADEAMVALFNALAKSLGLSFSLPLTVSITRARQIVSKWLPQMYESHLSVDEFCVPYILGQFFDRFISVDETLALQEVQAKTARKFLSVNMEGWRHDAYVYSDPRLTPLLDRMAYIIGDVLDTFSLDEIYPLCEHGPNSTTGVKFSDAYYDIKDFDVSGPVGSLQQFIHYLNSYNTTLKEVLMNESDEYRSCINAWHLDGLNVDDCTETSLVPKNWEWLRSMCPELTIPAFFGQGTGRAMGRRLLKIGIDLKTQTQVHNNLARLGSLLPELNIATVDWSQASDRVFIALCDRVMISGAAPRWLDWIKNVCRSNFTRVTFSGCLGVDGDFANYQQLWVYCYSHTVMDGLGGDFTIECRHSKGKVKKTYYTAVCKVRASMIGTMGNAVTFPLQTLLFYSFLTACTEMCQDRESLENGPNLPRDYQCVSCYGDDGIVDSRAMPEVELFAPLIGWKLNRDKSYWSGSFRESCGTDYYKGVETRALSFKRPNDNSAQLSKKNFQAWMYVCANACNELLDRFGRLPYEIDRWLEDYHAKAELGLICVVPPYLPDGSGLRITSLSPPVDVYTTKSKDIDLDIGCGLDPTLYHIPWYNVVHHEIVYYRLQNVPSKRTPRHEYSYYSRRLNGLDEPEVIHDVHLSFFDQHKVAVTQLDRVGEMVKKELKLHKVKAGCQGWNQPYGYIDN